MQFTQKILSTLPNFHIQMSDLKDICVGEIRSIMVNGRMTSICGQWASLIPPTSVCKKLEGSFSYLNLSWAPQWISDSVHSIYQGKFDLGYCRIYNKNFAGNEKCSTAINGIIERNFSPLWKTNFKDFSKAFNFGTRSYWHGTYSMDQVQSLDDSCSFTDGEIETRLLKLITTEKEAFSKNSLQMIFIVSSLAFVGFLLYKLYQKKSTNAIKLPTDATSQAAEIRTLIKPASTELPPQEKAHSDSSQILQSSQFSPIPKLSDASDSNTVH